MKYKLFTIFFLSLPLFIQAQNIGFDESGLRTLGAPLQLFEGLQEGEYSLDPHYDESGRIKYYGLGDIVRLSYSYNDTGQIETKTLYVRNDADNVWKKSRETSYTYLGGKLKEELTLQWKLSPFAGSSEIKEPDSRRHIRYVSGDRDKTDTMKIKMTFASGEEYKSSGVKYLNEKMLCDSLILYNDECIPYQKWVMTYDNKNRCTNRSVYFYRTIPPFSINEILGEDAQTYTSEVENMEPHILWWYAYEVKTVYDTDKTIYTCTTINNKKVYELALDYDAAKRLTGQMLTSRDGILTKGTFSYDKQGRTIVNKEILGGKLSEFRSLDIFRYDLQYNAEGQQVVTYNRYDRADEKYYKWRESFTRSTPSGLITFFRKNDYREDGELESTEKGENLYNDNGMLTRQITYFWDYDTNDWYERVKYIFDYDAQGNEILREYSLKSDEKSPWEGQSKNVYRYDASRRIIYDEYFKFSKGAWTNDTKKHYTFSPTGKSTSYTEYEWYDQSWKGVKRDSTTYNTDDSLKMQINYRWDSDTNKWDSWDKTEYEYTSRDSVNTETKKFYRFRDNQCEPWNFSSESRGPKSFAISQGMWDDASGSWTETSKQASYVDKDSYLVSEEYGWDREQNELVGLEKKMDKYIEEEISPRDYLPGNVADMRKAEDDPIILYQPYSRIRNKWNSEKRDWDFTTRYTYNNDSKHSLKILEVYDGSKWLNSVQLISYKDPDNIYFDKSIWNKDKNTWENSIREVTSIYKEAVDICTYYEWDKNSNKWVPGYKEEESRLPNDEEDTIGKLHSCYEWDNAKQQWIPLARAKENKYRGFFGEHTMSSGTSIWDKDKGTWEDSSKSTVEKKLAPYQDKYYIYIDEPDNDGSRFEKINRNEK